MSREILRLSAELDDDPHQIFLSCWFFRDCACILLYIAHHSPHHNPHHRWNLGRYPNHYMAISFPYRSKPVDLEPAPTRARKAERTARNDTIVVSYISPCLTGIMPRSYFTAMKADQSALMSPYSPIISRFRVCIQSASKETNAAKSGIRPLPHLANRGARSSCPPIFHHLQRLFHGSHEVIAPLEQVILKQTNPPVILTLDDYCGIPVRQWHFTHLLRSSWPCLHSDVVFAL